MRVTSSVPARDELAEAMLATGATLLLGSLTPSEVMQVSDLGAHSVKISPRHSADPPTFVPCGRRSRTSPSCPPEPSTRRTWPSGWIRARWLSVQVATAGRFSDIEDRARQVAKAVREWRES